MPSPSRWPQDHAGRARRGSGSLLPRHVQDTESAAKPNISVAAPLLSSPTSSSASLQHYVSAGGKMASGTDRLARFLRFLVGGCVALSLFVALVLFDEVIFAANAQARAALQCNDGMLAGKTAQDICIGAVTVTKVPRPCNNVADVLNCKVRLAKQVYTNRAWAAEYGRLDFIPSVVSFDGSRRIEMVKARHNATVKPNRALNRERFAQLDELLERNNHIAMDLQMGGNIFLDDEGGLVIVDFNVLPSWMRAGVERTDPYSFRLSQYRNIYGARGLVHDLL